jgi:hypothetical protein
MMLLIALGDWDEMIEEDLMWGWDMKCDRTRSQVQTESVDWDNIWKAVLDNAVYSGIPCGLLSLDVRAVLLYKGINCLSVILIEMIFVISQCGLMELADGPKTFRWWWWWWRRRRRRRRRRRWRGLCLDRRHSGNVVVICMLYYRPKIKKNFYKLTSTRL